MHSTRNDARNEREAHAQLASQATQRIADNLALQATRQEWAHVLRRSNPGRRQVIRLGLFAALAATARNAVKGA